MVIVNSDEAGSQLSELIRRARAGERIVIAQAGDLLVELLPFQNPTQREGGIWKGKVHMADDFDKPLTELEAEIYGPTLRN